MTPRRVTTIRDALYNFAANSGASDEYCKGLIVGVAAAAQTRDWLETVELLRRCLPDNARALTRENVPESWLVDLS